MKKRTSAVYSDPTSLASIFAMAHPSVLREIRAIDTGATAELSSSDLGRRFQSLEPRLCHVVDEVSGTIRYQIVVESPSSGYMQYPQRSRSQKKIIRWLAAFWTTSIPSLTVLFVAIVAIFILGTTLTASTDTDTTSNYIVSSFHMVIVTTAAVFLKICWATIERGNPHLHHFFTLQRSSLDTNHALLQRTASGSLSAVSRRAARGAKEYPLLSAFCLHWSRIQWS